MNTTMDYKEPKTKRSKKSDKAKASFERSGSFSQKHVRLSQSIAEKTATKSQASSSK